MSSKRSWLWRTCGQDSTGPTVFGNGSLPRVLGDSSENRRAESQLTRVSVLQERVVKLTKTEPIYAVVQEAGSSKHAPVFDARITIKGELAGHGRGASKKEAKRMAAIASLRWLDDQKVPG